MRVTKSTSQTDPRCRHVCYSTLFVTPVVNFRSILTAGFRSRNLLDFMFRTFFPFGCFGRRGLVSIRLWRELPISVKSWSMEIPLFKDFFKKASKFSHFVFITDISFVPFAARNNTFGRSTSIKPRRGHEVHVVLTKMRPCFVLSLLGFGVNRAEMSFGFTKLPGLTLQVPLDYTTSTPEPRRTNPLFSSKSAPTKCTNQRDLSVGLVTRTFLDSEFSFLSFETTTHKKTGGKSQHTNMGPNFEVRINKPKVFPKFVIHENTNGLKAVTHLLVARGVCSTFCSSAGVSKELIIESRSWRHYTGQQRKCVTKVLSQAAMASARSMRCREPISGLIVASKGLVGEVQVA